MNTTVTVHDLIASFGGMMPTFEQISPFFVGVVGASLTYFFTTRHERQKANELKAISVPN